MSRSKEIQAALNHLDMDGLLVTSSANLRYVANFTGTTGMALITKKDSYFITDFRYLDQAAEQAKDFKIVQNTGPILETVAELLEKKGLKNLAIENDQMSVTQFHQLQDLVDIDLVEGSGLVESFREIKDEGEVAKIKKAVEITEAAYAHILNFIQPGQTEIEIANELDFFMRKEGASGTSFETIVASGTRSALPHGVASQKEIQKNEMVTIDFGCFYEGYCSDMTRTFAIGDPGSQLKEIYSIVQEAQERVVKAAKPGITGKALDSVARDFIKEAGYGDHFGHSTGHSIGLEIHESPNVAQSNEEALEAGNVITAEPGIYIPGLGGVRIEDDLLLIEDGNENLMTSKKDLIVL